MTWEFSVAVIFVAIVFFFVKLVELLNQDEWFHKSIRLFIVLLSVWLVVLGASVCVEIAEANVAVAALQLQFNILYVVVIYFASVFTFLFVLYFLWQVFKAFRIDKQSKHDEMFGGK